jgi:hypothetical protein
MGLRLSPEKIEHIAKVGREERFTPAFTYEELTHPIENEVAILKQLAPVAVVTGLYPRRC